MIGPLFVGDKLFYGGRRVVVMGFDSRVLGGNPPETRETVDLMVTEGRAGGYRFMRDMAAVLRAAEPRA